MSFAAPPSGGGSPLGGPNPLSAIFGQSDPSRAPQTPIPTPSVSPSPTAGAGAVDPMSALFSPTPAKPTGAPCPGGPGASQGNLGSIF